MFSKNLTIRSQLACLVAACVLPVWLLAGLLVRHAYVAKLDEVHRQLLESARVMSMVVDRELANVQGALLALSTSPSFRERDFGAVHRQSLEILKSHPGADIIVADVTGQQLVNTHRSFGTPLPKRANTAIVDTIFQSGKPFVSNLFFGAVTKRPVIAIDVPVLLDGKVAYDLSLSFPSNTLSSILQRPNLFKGWYCTIFDRNGAIVARTRNLERYVGKQVDPGLLQALDRTNEGTVDVRNEEGEHVFAGYARLASGWAVTFGVPRATIMAQIYTWVAWATGGAAAISLFGIALAMGVARTIARDIQSLVSPALAIGRGEVITSVDSAHIRETSDVGDALVQASKLLKQRALERELAEAQLSLAMEDLKKETAERIRTVEDLRRSEQLLLQQSRQAALGEMIGNIAHQWRQPLNALGLLVQQPPLFYGLGEVDDKYLAEHSGKCMQLVRHMSETIDDFRNFFKPDKEKVPFNVRQVVAKTLSLIEGSFQGQQTVIEVEASADPVVMGYPNEFSQVLLNIIINARDAFTERKVSAPRIVIGIGATQGRAVVTVSDNAGGIPEEIIGKIFDPYFTTKGPQSGTGVGLFMSKSIIEKNMGGTLAARNVATGAEFRIEV